jgi:transcriptional regulator with XRE-family HTH domain
MREWLFETRTNQKFTQEKIAAESGISLSFYSLIESGDRRPSVKVAKRIADVLGFEWTKFFE